MLCLQISGFPVYSDLGQIDVEIKTNYQTIVLTEDQVDKMASFHKILFIYIMKAVRKCFAYDEREDVDGYFIVPLIRSKFVATFLQNFKSDVMHLVLLLYSSASKMSRMNILVLVS